MESREQMGGPPGTIKQESMKDERESLQEPVASERFEFRQGNSSNFWEPSVEENVFSVRFGKIGTEGRIYKQSFSSHKEAADEKQKLIREKIRKGYALVSEREDLGVEAGSKHVPVKKTATREIEGAGMEEDEEPDQTVTIPRDATFAELFSKIDAIEEKIGLGELLYEAELVDGFPADIVDVVLSFRDTSSGEAETTKVLDFFKERGYSESDITAFLPIKFKRKRKQR